MAETKRGIDVEKMKAAMDRAAEKAMHGTHEERSGRFALSDDARSTAERQKQPSVPSKRSPDERSDIRD